MASAAGVDVDPGPVERDGDALLRELGLDGELSVLLCNDARIHDLNKQWRGKDGPTDVLSFPQDDDQYLGDVVISIDTASRAATRLGHDVATEVRVLLVHGLCHLLGHDHGTADDTAAMRALEARLLGVLGCVNAGLVERADAE